MPWSIANKWDTAQSKTIAKDIADIAGQNGLYCGPAVVIWIAAVWNLSKGRSYDYKARARDLTRFPDGPRRFFGSGPGFQRSLNDILKQETNNELKLAGTTYWRYSTIHKTLEKYDMPIIIRMLAPNFLDGLHYTTLYKTYYKERSLAVDKIKFYWQDNGVYGRRNGGNPGLYGTSYRNVGYNIFPAGAKRVTKV
jgi:hypothetical protein